MLVYLFISGVHSRPLRVGIAALALLMVSIIGLSRIYLQVHYLSDVIAGFAAGLLWLSFCITGLGMNRRRNIK